MDTLSLELLSISSHFPLFFTMYFILYLNAYFIFFRGWARKLRTEASSCVMSLAHGYPAVFLACRAILSDPGLDFHSPNTSPQNIVLDYSIAYFSIDLLHLLIFEPSSVLFIGHHLISLFGFLTCRYVVYHGAFAILGLLILAEVTSLCQNVWALASMRRSDVELAGKVFDLISPPFYALYSIIRGLFGPYFVYRMWAFYGTGVADDVMPQWVWISWVSLAVVMIFFSIFRISNLWIELYRERMKKIERKLR
ncbi:UNVERIFIED_CONTAM: TLC domain-containing protein [Sesamum latifolium]|uniref:TLC domain-containing protein n=1 Tax=Sesamum latifolium TaxID=2727402 RepID=A0AAW2Y7R4_9LAMI